MKPLTLIIEKSNNNKLWGRVEINDDLIIDSADSINKLEKSMKRLLKAFHDIDEDKIQFDVNYDLSALFAHKAYLNVTAIAAKAGINPTLMRQYASGVKFPSLNRAKQIEQVINDLGKELIAIKVAVRKPRTTNTTTSRIEKNVRLNSKTTKALK